MECNSGLDYFINCDGESRAVTGPLTIFPEINERTPYVISGSLQLYGYPTSIKLIGFHRDKPNGGTCQDRSIGEKTMRFYDQDYPCIINRRITGFFGIYDGGSYYEFTLTPIGIDESNVTFKKSDGTNAINLFVNDKTTVSAPAGYHPKTYHWQYRIGDSGDYTDLPSSFQGLNTFDICMKDFVPNIADVAGKKNVWIALNIGCGSPSQIVKSLTTMIDCPYILSAQGNKAPCLMKPGNITVELDRDLYDGESLNFVLYDSNVPGENRIGNQIGSDQIVSLGNRKYKINVPPGKYDIQVLSYFGNDRDKVNNSNTSDNFFRKNIVVGEANPFTIKSLTKFSPICKGVDDGSITVKAAGGSGLYWIKCTSIEDDNLIYQSGQKAGETTITNLPAGGYNLYLMDSEGCQSDEIMVPVDLDEPENPVRITALSDYREASLDEILQEEENGMLTITIEGGKAPYSATWRKTDQSGTILYTGGISIYNSRNISTLWNINSGDYYVEIQDAQGCLTDTIINLPKAPEIYVKLESTGTIQCAEDHTGSLEAEISGGHAPYQITWYKDNSSYQQNTGVYGIANLSGIGIGQYRLLVVDNLGSRAWSQAITLSEITHFNIAFDTKRLDCYNSANGYLQIDVTGGQAPYTYSWSNGSSGNRIENLSEGNYPVLITDVNNCAASAIGEVRGPSQLNIQSVVNHPSCAEMGNGQIQLYISGATAPYQISWNNGSTQNLIQNLSTGTYSVTITDVNACETIDKTFSIQAPQPVNASVQNIKPVSAFGRSDGRIKILVSGGTSPYLITGKSGADTYYALYTTEQPDHSVLYEFQNLKAGDYIFDIKDRNYQTSVPYNPCKTQLEIQITQPPKLTVSAEISKQIACHNGNDGVLVAHAGGGVPLTSSLPYTYQWYRMQGMTKTLLPCTDSIFNEASKGKYQVLVLDKNNVEAFFEIEIDHPRLLSVRLEPTNVICDSINSGSIRSFVTGGEGSYEYLWSNGETTPNIKSLIKGRYTLAVTDELGCRIAADTTVLNPTEIKFNPTLYLQSCSGHNDAAIYLNPKGGQLPYSFQWSSGETDMFLENKTPGTYTVILTDAENCVTDTTFVIPDLPPIQANLVELAQPKAFGYSDGSLQVEITGGYQPYKIKWVNEHGDVLYDDSIQVQNGKAISELKNLPTGTYFLRIEDSNYPVGKNLNFDPCGCLHEFSIFLPEPPKLEVSIEKSHNISCFDGNDGGMISKVQGGVPFDESLPYVYTWYYNDAPLSVNDSIADRLKSGTYKLKITDANGIEAWSEEVPLDQPDQLKITLNAADLKCSRDTNGWAEVNATGGTAPYNFEWSTGDSTPRIEQVPRGKYMVWVKDSRGCEQIGNVSIIQPDSIRITAELRPPFCNGGSDGEIRVKAEGGMPPYRYNWENGSTSPTHSGLKKGSYTITVTDINECSYETATYELGEPDSVKIDLGKNRELCLGQGHEVEAKVKEPAHSFNWFSPQGVVLFTGEKYTLYDPGTYQVEAVTNKGCKVTGDITITRNNQKVEAEFMVASKVPIHDDIYFVNVTNAVNDSIEWILPETSGYSVLSANKQELKIMFDEYGIFTFGMRSFLGNCYETVYKAVRVMNKIDIENYEDADGPTLRLFTVYPNPSREHFAVEIELGKASKAVLSLVDSGTGKTVERRVLENKNKFKEEFQLPSGSSGTYILHLAAPEVRSSLKVIIHN